jgi:hypothetical protein
MLRRSDDFGLTSGRVCAEYSPAKLANAQALRLEETT